MKKIILHTILVSLLITFAAVSNATATVTTVTDTVEVTDKIRVPTLSGNDRTSTGEQLSEEDEYGEISLRISTGMYHQIVPASVIVGKNGKNISMDNLQVPCKARLTLQVLDSGYTNVEKMEVIRSLPGASTEWYESPPQ